MIGVLRAQDFVRRSWKNGGGVTAEVAVAPEGADFERFEWRISFADVAADGPFSAFAGIDRTFMLIDGPGVDLTVDGALHRLDPTAPALAFPGEADTRARLVAGPIRDLNVMTRRGRFSHRVRRETPGDLAPSQKTSIRFVAATAGPATVRVGRDAFALGPLDVLRVEAASGDGLHLDGIAVSIEVWVSALG